jgi:hypothetical protein
MTTIVLFSVETPLGFVVTVAKQRWELIVTQKHPVLAGQEELIKDTLLDPDEIRRSKSDETVYLFYRSIKEKRWACAVVKSQYGDVNFLITAYPTDAVKEGEVIWTK